MVGWTTLPDREAAERLARSLVEAGLAACTQVSGPITSCYRWQVAVETAVEYRVTVKYLAANDTAVARWLEQHHPYDTPQWVAVRADAALEKYLNWAAGNPT